MEHGRKEAIRKKVENYLQQYQMLDKEDSVLVGVSGGADSIALLDLLDSWKGQLFQNVYAVHIHHGLRGQEADRDASFVEKFCKNRNIPCRIVYKKVREQAKLWKMGEEETGRILRYQAFEEYREILRKEEGRTVKLAVAHHGNDLAETMLHHMARGTGLRGLGGIRPVQGQILRPLLCLEREEIEAYLAERELSFVQDSTNASEAYTRNRIRHQLLGAMREQINPQTVAHMRELAILADQADEYLEETALEKLKQSGMQKEPGAVFLPEAFFREKEILIRYGVRKVLEELAEKSRDLSGNHMDAVVQLAGKQVGRTVCLPYEIQAEKVYGGILLQKKEKKIENETDSKEVCIALNPPETVFLENGTLELNIFFKKEQKISEKKYTKWLDYDRIKNKLCIRRRLPGDYLIVDRQGHRKKLNRYFIDEKIPSEEREKIWLLASGSEVFWVLGGRISETAKVKDATKRILEITFTVDAPPHSWPKAEVRRNMDS